jgi:hypothetical protein
MSVDAGSMSVDAGDVSVVEARDASSPIEAASDSLVPDGADDSWPPDSLPLPLDPSVPIIVNNDGPFDNWQGEHAVLSVLEGRQLLALIINDSWAWPDLDSNVAGWQRLVEAARADGVEGIPDPLRSEAARLERPASGMIEDTNPNRSAGAQAIVNAVLNLDANGPPLAVVTGGRLTEVADAYLIDPTIADRMVVVSSLGDFSEGSARMTIPNGEMDPWADTIVADRLRYVQVSAFYRQRDDLPEARLPDLPGTALGAWITEKRPRLPPDLVACDQVALLAATTPGFVLGATRAFAEALVPFDEGEGPTLVGDMLGTVWLVTEIDGGLATERFWRLVELNAAASPR